MTYSKIILSLISIIFLFAISMAPALAVVYTPGVSTGQYATYGNFIGVGPGEETINNTAYVKQQVTAVSGKEITLLTTGQLKDGSPTPGNGSVAVWNIETGTLNGLQDTQGPIIAANLNQGDAIPPPDTYTINSTETRTYMSVSRTVNILNPTITTPDYTTSFTFVYDQASGILLQATSITIQTQNQSAASEYSYIITETNIFGTTQNSPTPSATIPEYSTVGLVAVACLATIAVIIFRRKQND